MGHVPPFSIVILVHWGSIDQFHGRIRLPPRPEADGSAEAWPRFNNGAWHGEIAGRVTASKKKHRYNICIMLIDMMYRYNVKT